MEGFKKDDLEHYGLKGQKWGIRKYQNKDGTYTEAGKKRYNREQKKASKLTAQARVSSRAVRLAEKKTHKAKVKAHMAPTDKNRLSYAANRSALEKLREKNGKNIDAINTHIDELKKTYGEKNVKGLRVNRHGVVKDSVMKKQLSDIVVSTAFSTGVDYVTKQMIKDLVNKSVSSIAGTGIAVLGASFVGVAAASQAIKSVAGAAAKKAKEDFVVDATYKKAYNQSKRNIKKKRKY